MIIEVKDFLKQKECNSLIKKYNSEVTKCITGEGYSVSGNLKKGNINPFARKTDLVVFHNHALRESIIDTISNKLNIPVNIAFVPGRKGTQKENYYSDDEGNGYEYAVDYNTGNRFSITFGFNISK